MNKIKREERENLHTFLDTTNTVDLVAIVLTPNFKDLMSKDGIEQATKMIDKLINYWLDNPMEGFKRGVELLANKDKIKAMAVAKAIREGVDPDKAMPILDKIIKNIPTIEIDFLLLLLFGCKDDTNMIKCKGIPDVNQAFAYMYFKTEYEGYLFGTYTEYEELSEKELENPNNIPKSTDEANIYKTIDGGKNWVKINSSLNYSYFNIGTQLNDYIYILRNDVRENYNFSIVAFNIKKENIKNFTNIKPISAIWTNNSKIFYTNNRGPIKLYSLDKNQNIDSIDIENYALQGLGINEKSYAIFSSGETSYFGSTEKENKEIKLSITPQSIVRQGNNTIIIAGNTLTDKNEISLISYKPNARQSRVVKKIKNYSIIKNLQSNDKAIIGFIGNIKGAFAEYDLLYSLDKGKTWQIKKLEEPNYVHPNCLINNIVYIYGGGARMQKIVL